MWLDCIDDTAELVEAAKSLLNADIKSNKSNILPSSLHVLLHKLYMSSLSEVSEYLSAITKM